MIVEIGLEREKMRYGTQFKEAVVGIPGKQKWWPELGTACGHRIKWTGLEIFKDLMTNWIQRVKKMLK